MHAQTIDTRHSLRAPPLTIQVREPKDEAKVAYISQLLLVHFLDHAFAITSTYPGKDLLHIHTSLMPSILIIYIKLYSTMAAT